MQRVTDILNFIIIAVMTAAFMALALHAIDKHVEVQQGIIQTVNGPGSNF